MRALPAALCSHLLESRAGGACGLKHSLVGRVGFLVRCCTSGGSYFRRCVACMRRASVAAPRDIAACDVVAS